MRQTRRTTALITIGMVSAVLTGCGSEEKKPDAAPASSSAATTTSAAPTTSKPDPSKIVKQAFDGAKAAKAVHVVIDFQGDGKKSHIDMAGAMDGNNMKAVVKDDSTGNYEVIAAGGSTWMKLLDKTSVDKAGASAGATGKFLPVKGDKMKNMAGGAPKDLLDKFIGAVNMDWIKNGKASVEPITVGGVKAWKISDPAGGGAAYAVVSDDSKNELLEVGKVPAIKVAFSQWDAVATIAPPTGDQLFKQK
ncbi:hypothetical protein KEM60_01498 [Austwickia sp. TVS 96-490-7B]|uniref:hypothetical protein n=1 Tax=Austwickia sp. TVS 96-490-7B TaxID=2830843 RepID=UPI001C55B9B0|nr:hypothetical protein [Austwickia sp. TVS 96-490-7B]MBW3085301.1 hypothetical protein [Austwickia sp. TVS 96-490-7B]